ncbi:uncharacterized protein LOC129738239 [Uranotaenia lowii]|uniref:uncharacterized protein LOC129738239 n=1 Tax=Uranotaenia lowii TaxID=190385 RepID=UPI002478F0D7|nr:uncharacterized protein LOC129738239 [Uranotaenia lowii]
MAYYGVTKDIPVIIHKKFRNLASAEAATLALTNTDVSDIETKRKKLKASKPCKAKKNLPVDYNKQFVDSLKTNDVVCHKQAGPNTLEIEQPAGEIITEIEVEEATGNMISNNLPSHITTFEAYPGSSNQIVSYQDISQSPANCSIQPLVEHFGANDVKTQLIVEGPNSPMSQDDVMYSQNEIFYVAPQTSTTLNKTPSSDDRIVQIIENLKAHIETTIEKVVEFTF